MAETAAARKKREAAEAAALEAQHAAEGAIEEVNNEGPSEPEVEHEDNIVQLINQISREAGALAPEQKAGVPFPFRGVDGTVNHLAPKLRKYGVVVVPEVLSCVVTPNAQGNRTVKTAEVLTKFTFWAPDMKTAISATTAGLADDYGDRATAQAQSVAYRIALLQTFNLPTMDKEPEQTGIEVENGAAKAAPQQPRAMAVVQNAKQPPATSAVPDPRVLQTQIKAAAGVRGVTGAQINAFGATHANGKAPDEWLNDTDVLNKVLLDIQKLPLAD